MNNTQLAQYGDGSLGYLFIAMTMNPCWLLTNILYPESFMGCTMTLPFLIRWTSGKEYFMSSQWMTYWPSMRSQCISVISVVPNTRKDWVTSVILERYLVHTTAVRRKGGVNKSGSGRGKRGKKIVFHSCANDFVARNGNPPLNFFFAPPACRQISHCALIVHDSQTAKFAIRRLRQFIQTREPPYYISQ